MIKRCWVVGLMGFVRIVRVKPQRYKTNERPRADVKIIGWFNENPENNLESKPRPKAENRATLRADAVSL